MNTLHEPYLLSSYTPPLRSITKGSFVVDVTCTEYDRKGFATVTVQGDGIHILEASEMRPVVSHTLGPDTRFICPSITQVDASATMSTYAITNEPNASNEGSKPKYVLRKWTDSLLDNATPLSEKKSSPDFIENIHRLYTIPNKPSKLIALSVSGHMYILSTETLNIEQFFQHSTSTSILFRSFVFSPDSCTFASRRVKSDGTLIMRFVLENNILFVNLCLLSSNTMEEIASIRLCHGEGVIDITCSTSGYIMILTSSGARSIFRLDEEGQLIKEATISNQPVHSEIVTPKYRGFSVTSITPSFVLFACIEGSTNLHLMLLDLRFSVIHTTQTFPLPSNLTPGPKNSLQVKLVTATQTEVVIRVSPSKVSEASSPRSAIFILPLNVSKSSSIALAMGKAQVWPPKAKMFLSRDDAARQGLLGQIEAAIKKGVPQEADNIFFTWVKTETGDKGIVDHSDSKFGRRSVQDAHQGSIFPKMSYRFVASLLDIVIQPAKASDIPYSSEIPTYLIERKAVSDNMVQGGFVSTLGRKGDWKSICAALRNMADIPEQEVVNLLIRVLANHKRSSGAVSDGDAMDTGSSDEGIPTLASFLSMVIQYQSSSPAACYAFKTCLTNVDDVILILRELDQILETVCNQDFTSSAVYLPSLPPLPSLFPFMQYIFDAHFLTLLQHPPAQPLLRQISGRLQDIIFMIQEFDYLREPLGSVIQARAQGRTTNTTTDQQESKKGKKISNIIGLYQVEELVL